MVKFAVKILLHLGMFLIHKEIKNINKSSENKIFFLEMVSGFWWEVDE